MIKGIVRGFFIGSLVVGAMALPAEAHRWHHHHHGHHGHGHFLGGFLAGAATALLLDALLTPRVVREPRYYYRGMICRDVLIPGRWELRTREQNGFTTYYHVRVPGYWRRECY